ncbi:hypothetical protein NDU88_007657 [Pleurodeles waltl]|uniref:Uncharacterized protein n=1 Tax=Pleurodeles waltl TaxID=8319 RepID=A0AAV7NTX5_PLEWA|nr:hypothetical protein NDU88_007657 [Pleurodeles waltl]
MLEDIAVLQRGRRSSLQQLDKTRTRDDHCRLAKKVSTAKKQIKEVLPTVNNADKTISKMERQIHDLELRAKDA